MNRILAIGTGSAATVALLTCNIHEYSNSNPSWAYSFGIAILVASVLVAIATMFWSNQN